MSITPLKRLTLVGPRADKDAILARLQGLGCMHLVPLRPPPAEPEQATSPRADHARKALRFLVDCPQRRRQVLRAWSFDVDELVETTLRLQQQMRDVGDRRDFLAARIDDIEPWGNIDFPTAESIGGFRLWFYILPAGQARALEHIDLPWQIVRRDYRYAYVVVIAREEPPPDLLPVPRSHVGALPLAELRAQLEETEIELEDLHARREALTRYLYLLRLNLAEADNRAALIHAAEQTWDDEALVAVQGWVPVAAVPAVEAYAAGADLACVIEDAGAGDEPPTLIEQPEQLEAGVDLATFYQVPSYRSWDPTVLLFGSFSLFFAMILADAGYGMVLMTGLVAFWRRLGRSARGRAYRLLGLSLAGCTVVYGAMVGSYFGLTPPDDTLLDALHVLSLSDFDAMMRLSIVVGVLHIGLANAITAWVNRRSTVALSQLGWIAAIAGGLALWLSGGGSGAGTAMVVGGLLAVLLFSSRRPLRRPADALWRLLDGLRGVQRALNAFGDVLSYMRLFALGLASASLAVTFNDLARDVLTAAPGVGLLGAILILAIGHALNLALALMSGVVHGLRLNFIEFFNWGLTEEGTSFRRFARKEVEP